MLACILVFAGLATIGSSGSDCSDNSYALSHPEVCGAAVEGCEDNNYALTHPLECGSPVAGCDDNNYALTHPLECGKAAVGCDDNNYALTHPLECGKKVGCEDNDYALTHPLECGKQVPQVCTPGSRRWGSLPETLSPSLCRSDWTAITDCNQYGQWVFIDCVSPYEDTCTPSPSTSCSVLGCGNYDSCGSFCGSCPPPAVVDNAPTAAINVPASAAPNSQLNIVVTGNDDKDVAQLLLFDSSNVQIGTPFDCTGVQTSCSRTFTVAAPSTHSASYTFKARSKDNAGQLSVLVSGSGETTAAPSPPSAPPPVTVVTQLIQQPGVSLRFPLQPLFMRSVSFQDSDCIRPGESALLAVKVRNTGKSALKGVSFAATVPEIGVRARSGPHTITATDKLTRFLRLDIPDDAEEGSYYLRLSVTNNRFSKVVHRAFTVGRSC